LKDDLEKVRDWAEARIKAGDVLDWSWHYHVELIETIDAVLHDLSMAKSSRPIRRPLPSLRLVERGLDQQADLHVTPSSLVRRKGRIPH
jgi:hypothetical protein